jgi:hypothetical protein
VEQIAAVVPVAMSSPVDPVARPDAPEPASSLDDECQLGGNG